MSDKQSVAEALNKVLGNSYILYMQTHSYHWNVTGPRFSSLHNLFEGQYRQMWESLDDIAERIRTLGEFAPTSSRAMAEAATLKESDNTVPEASSMLRNLVDGHTTWLKDAETALDEAGEAGEVGVEDLLSGLISAHEKMRWMLESSM